MTNTAWSTKSKVASCFLLSFDITTETLNDFKQFRHAAQFGVPTFIGWQEQPGVIYRIGTALVDRDLFNAAGGSSLLEIAYEADLGGSRTGRL